MNFSEFFQLSTLVGFIVLTINGEFFSYVKGVQVKSEIL